LIAATGHWCIRLRPHRSCLRLKLRLISAAQRQMVRPGRIQQQP
jgi:hypothetical protein